MLQLQQCHYVPRGCVPRFQLPCLSPLQVQPIVLPSLLGGWLLLFLRREHPPDQLRGDTPYVLHSSPFPFCVQNEVLASRLRPSSFPLLYLVHFVESQLVLGGEYRMPDSHRIYAHQTCRRVPHVHHGAVDVRFSGRPVDLIQHLPAGKGARRGRVGILASKSRCPCNLNFPFRRRGVRNGHDSGR